MKKIIFILFTMLIMLTSCKINKEPVTAENFKAKMEENGYTVENITSQYPQDTKLKAVLIAKKNNYQIEFYETSDVDYSVIGFNLNKEKFQKSKGNGTIETSKSIGNSSKYTLKANSKFKVVSRIKNTLIYLDVPASDEDEVKKILKELNY